MLFNSLSFLLFAVVFVTIYFLLKGRVRIAWCLLGSYFFYGWWDSRFLLLIIFSTLLDFFLGKRIHAETDIKKRKLLLWCSVFANLGTLAFFKYCNFFIESFSAVLQQVGLSASISTLEIILPVGISFYTFQSMSYTIDIYRKKLEPEKQLIRFATYIAFWPQLVAGPIVRAGHLLPQLRIDQRFDPGNLVIGLSFILWGFFKKVVIADNLGLYVDQCWLEHELSTSLTVWLAVFFFSIQIYCDFSGYSSIAIGFAKILGFDFPRNFASPYFAKGFSEFWRRWHISLSSWLRDYLYIPLGGNRHGRFRTGINLTITMLLGGLWHGASWTFVAWGGLHALYLIGERVLSRVPGFSKISLPSWLVNPLKISTVFALVSFAWIFFRSPSFEIAVNLIERMLDWEEWRPELIRNKLWAVKGLGLVGILVVLELVNQRLPLHNLALRSPLFRMLAFASLLWLISFFGSFGSNSFIYFQF